MRSVRGMAVLIGAATLALGGMSAANASTPGPGSCSGGPIYGGTYSSFTVTGNCYLADGANLLVLGNLNINSGAGLDATVYSTSSLTVRGSVNARGSSLFAMGCSEAHPCQDNMPKYTGQDSVYANVSLSGVHGAAINNTFIGGSLSETGGGAGLSVDFPPFSVKDNTVNGNISITGLRTGWFGVIRNQVGGNVNITGNKSANSPNDPYGMQQDSSEVVANEIGGNLSCTNNTPHAQFGDAAHPVSPFDYGWNDVRGLAFGECVALVRPAVQPH